MIEDQKTIRAVLLVGSLALGLGSMVGCQEVLFKKNATRTQFETHDRLRQRYVPLQQNNVFGEPEPALRARLSPER